MITGLGEAEVEGLAMLAYFGNSGREKDTRLQTYQ